MNISLNEKLILMILAVQEERSFKGIIKLSKAIFMIQNEINNKENNFSYNFYRWDYGPFDKEIHRDLKNLEDLNLISTSFTNTPEKMFVLTNKGFEVISYLMDTYPHKDVLFNWSSKFHKMNRNEVLNFIYKKFKISSYEMGDKILT